MSKKDQLSLSLYCNTVIGFDICILFDNLFSSFSDSNRFDEKYQITNSMEEVRIFFPKLIKDGEIVNHF